MDLLVLPSNGQKNTIVGLSLVYLSGVDIIYIPLKYKDMIEKAQWLHLEEIWKKEARLHQLLKSF
ncbi:MAG TPA: hypothetical protein DGG95_09695 [Cytophagales bacterium]|nr:hypothetical protein [Cytophagales bacterium]